MPKIGYRCPFAMIGYKGAAEGTAVMALEKTKVLVRLEAEFTHLGAKQTGVEVAMKQRKCEKINVTELLLGE